MVDIRVESCRNCSDRLACRGESRLDYTVRNIEGWMLDRYISDRSRSNASEFPYVHIIYSVHIRKREDHRRRTIENDVVHVIAELIVEPVHADASSSSTESRIVRARRYDSHLHRSGREDVYIGRPLQKIDH